MTDKQIDEEQIADAFGDLEGIIAGDRDGEAALDVLRQALERQRDRPPLEWKQHERDGGVHTEWTAPCGCAYHPQPFPHVHPCSDAHKRPDLHDGERQRVPEGYALVPVELWWKLQASNWQTVHIGSMCKRLEVTYYQDQWERIIERLAAAPEPDGD